MSGDRNLLFCLLSFLGGSVLGLLYPQALLLVSLLLLVFFLILFTPFQTRKSLFFIFFFLFLFVGMYRGAEEIRFWQENSFPETLSFSGEVRILVDSKQKDFYTERELWQINCEKEACLPQKILWRAPLDGEWRAGTKGFFRCELEKPKNFDESFDYRMYLAKEGVLFICPEGKGEFQPLDADRHSEFLGGLFVLKNVFEVALKKALPEPESGLARGLLLGGNDHLSEPLQEAFRRIGLSHIVAVSGYNITLVTELFLALGIAFGFFRKQALLLATLGIFLFVLFVGAPASAVRAGLMAGVGFAALQAGRLGRPVNLLLLAAVGMVFFSPLILLYDIGFQLSFLATFALIFGASWFEDLFPNEFFGKKLVEIEWLTGIIELFILPLLLFYFQAFSWFSLLANIVLLPIIPFAMAFSFGTALSFLLLPGAHFLFSFPAYFLLTALTRFAEFFGTLPFVSLETEKLSLLVLFLWYAFLAGLFLFLEQKRRKKWYASAFTFPKRS